MTLPSDVGLCEQCSAKNSHAATKCHQCSTVLPWVNPAKGPALKADKPARDFQMPSAPQIDFPVLPVLGGLVFAAGVVLWCGNSFGFFPTFPGVGYVTILIGGAIFRAGCD